MEEEAARGEGFERLADEGRTDGPAPGRPIDQEGRVGTGVAGNERIERALAGLEKDIWDAERGHCAKGIAIAAGIFDGDPTGLAGDTDGTGAMGGFEGCEPIVELCGLGNAGMELIAGEVAETAEEVVQLVGVAGLPPGREGLEFEFEVLEDFGVEEFAEFVFAEEVAEEVAVESEGLGATLGEWGIALIHVGGDVIEEEGACKGRGFARFDGMDANFAATYLREELDEAREVKHVAEALAVGL